MRKLIAATLLFMGIPAAAAYVPVALSTGGVNSSTVAVVNAGGVAIKVDGSGATQPVSGNVAILQPTVLGATVTFNGTQNVAIMNGLNAVTTTYVVNPTTSPIQIQASGGALTSVGFQTSGGSVPVQVQNTVTVTGNVKLAQDTVLGATVTFNGTQNVSAAQSGTWTVQPGNTANTTAWLMTIFGTPTVTLNGTQPVTIIGTPTVQGILSDNGAAAATNRTADLPGIYQNNYLNGTAATQGRNAALSVGTDGMLWTASLPSMRPASYSVSTNTIASASGAQDISCMSGNASNTVMVYGLRVGCTETTAGVIKLTVIKRSVADTGAWSTMTVVQHDSNYTGPVSTATYFTANPVLGTSVGEIDNAKLGCMATGTAAPNDIYLAPSSWKMKPIVLRGTAQQLCVNLQGQTVTGGSFAVSWDWMETTTITP